MIIKRNKEDEIFWHIFWISIVYFLAHGFLFIATGRWWDDWVYADKNWGYLLEVFTQSSIPSLAYIDGFLWLFPDGVYRIFVFVIFYLGSVLFYHILRKLHFLSLTDCFWIMLFYVTAPVNDARITWICWPYSLGLFMYWSSFYLATMWKEENDKKRRCVIRFFSIFALFMSFHAESIMILTSLIIGYFLYVDFKDDFVGWTVKDIKRLSLQSIQYMDYWLAPIIWYFGTKMLYPGYGVYGGHSYVSWGSLWKIIACSPIYVIITLRSLILEYIMLLLDAKIFFVSLLFFILLLAIMWRQKKFVSYEGIMSFAKVVRQDCWMLLIGGGVFFLGAFPYIVKRNAPLRIIHTGGRDALLLGIGLSILLYYGIKIMFRHKIHIVLSLCVVVLGVIHFNVMYLDWQEAYYQQLQMRHEISHNEEIKRNNTFLVMFKGYKVACSFYQTNGNSWAATGEQTRFFMSGESQLRNLIEMDSDTWFLNAYGMKEYDYTDKYVDGIIFVDYKKIGTKELLRAKWNELFRKEAFDSWIGEIKNIKYVPLTKKESEQLISLFIDKKLTDETIYRMYYPVVYK